MHSLSFDRLHNRSCLMLIRMQHTKVRDNGIGTTDPMPQSRSVVTSDPRGLEVNCARRSTLDTRHSTVSLVWIRIRIPSTLKSVYGAYGAYGAYGIRCRAVNSARGDPCHFCCFSPVANCTLKGITSKYSHCDSNAIALK